MKGPSMWLDMVRWTVVWADTCYLAWTCPCLERCLLGGCPLRGSVTKRCGLFAGLFRLGNSTGGGGGLLFEITLLGCSSGALVVRMIPLDRLSVPLCRFFW